MSGWSTAWKPREQASLQSQAPELHAARAATEERIRGIFVYDETGDWLAATEQVDVHGLNNSDRDYFKRHRALPERRTSIGRPIKSRSGGQWIITASRRFNHPDGSFGGVALVTIDVAYFQHFYEQFDLGPNGAVSLLSTDGTVLARSHDDGVYVGRDLSSSPLFRDRLDRSAASVYYFKSPLDGVQRLSFYRSSDRYPIVVLATKSMDDVLASWRQEALTRLAFVLVLTVLIAAIGYYLVRHLHERQLMARALVAKEADFRLLAEQSSDMVMRIGLDGRIHYVSPSCTRIVGRDPAQLNGSPALNGINAEDLPPVEKIVSALKLGEAEEATIAYRIRHREKGEIWIETALRATRAPETGEINGVVAVSRDITEHKALENRLEALAASDGLTGLANRRVFDERLREEWVRAKRDGTPLSLLLIDVDHFKKFNDLYGHLAGDGCLRSIARILAGQVRRPADLAARFGGEEFVLLLPNTDAEGCEKLGEKVREALHDLGMLHAASPTSKQVTVSLGGATSLPAAGTVECLSLVEAADRALYSAKDRGRDRLVMSGQVVAWPGVKTHAILNR